LVQAGWTYYCGLCTAPLQSNPWGSKPPSACAFVYSRYVKAVQEPPPHVPATIRPSISATLEVFALSRTVLRYSGTIVFRFSHYTRDIRIGGGKSVSEVPFLAILQQLLLNIRPDLLQSSATACHELVCRMSSSQPNQSLTNPSGLTCLQDSSSGHGAYR
jgi:hypothetical protein